MELYYHNFHSGSFILPRKEIEAGIHDCSHLYIDPCICRMFNNNCDNPIYNCLRINFAAKVRQEETGISLNKEEALKIIKSETSTINLYFKRIYLELAMIPLVLVFKLLKGSQNTKLEIWSQEKKIYMDERY